MFLLCFQSNVDCVYSSLSPEVRVMLGLHEEVARIYIKDRRVADEISNDVAQFLNLSLVECHAKLEKFNKKLKWICAK
jgi:hypothetical protein